MTDEVKEGDGSPPAVTPARKRPILSARTALAAMQHAGIITDTDRVLRAVVDINAMSGVKVYLMMNGDDRWLNVLASLDGVEVQTKAAPAPDPADQIIRQPPPRRDRRAAARSKKRK